jgi:aldehyde:ferredoxin oxidoreductase
MEAITYWLGYGVRLAGWYDPEEYDPHDSTGKGQEAVDWQNYNSVYNPLGICKFIIKGLIGPQQVVDLVNTALGWEWTVEDLLTTGERLFQLKRLINLRLGVTAADDTLPRRFLAEPRPSGGAEGVLPDLDLMLEDYYRLRDWSPEGVPSPERLAELDLE